MHSRWRRYLKRRSRRPQLRDRSRFTKYTISILHQYEDLLQKGTVDIDRLLLIPKELYEIRNVAEKYKGS